MCGLNFVARYVLFVTEELKWGKRVTLQWAIICYGGLLFLYLNRHTNATTYFTVSYTIPNQ